MTGSAPEFRNDSFAIAAVSGGKVWSSRSQTAAELGERWGRPIDLPIVSFDGSAPLGLPVNLDKLLPASGTRYFEIGNRLDGPSRAFGDKLIAILEAELKPAGLWRPGKLKAIDYSDRFVHSPLAVLLVASAATSLAKQLGAGRSVLLKVRTNPLRFDDRDAFRFNHDWRDEVRRAEVFKLFATRNGLVLDFDQGQCPHSRKMRLVFDDGEATIVLDQGFGFLKPDVAAQFDFRAGAAEQERRLASLNVILRSEGSSYFVVTGSS